MRIVKGWTRIDNDRGYINATTGQNLIIAKKQYAERYILKLLPDAGKNEEDGKTISPEFPNATKAETFSLRWMIDHPKGTE